MKTNKITKWAALLLTFSGMAALPLTVSAVSKSVNAGQSLTESGTAYDDATSYALWVGGGTYNGTNITIATTIDSRTAVRVINQGSLILNDSSVANSGSSTYGVQLDNSSGTLSQVTINSTGLATRSVEVSNTSTLTVYGGTIAQTLSNGNNSTITRAINYSTLTLNDVVVKVVVSDSGYGEGSGLGSINSSTLTVNGGSIITVGGSFGYGVITNRAVSTLSNVNVQTSGWGSYGALVINSGTLTVTGGTISTTGIRAHGAGFGSEPGNLVTLNNVTISVSGAYSSGVDMTAPNPVSGTNTLIVNGGVISSAQDAGISINKDRSAEVNRYQNASSFGGEITNNVIITGGAQINGAPALEVGSVFTATDASGNHQLDIGTVANVSVSDNSELNGDVNIKDTANVTVDFDNSKLTGNVNGSGSSTLNVSGSNGSTITGDINAKDDSNVSVNLDNGTVIGDITGSGSSTLNISGSNGSSITGNVNANDDAKVNVNLDDSKLTGDINSSGSSTINISGSNGSTVTGTATSKDDSNINVNISGPGSSWLGDVNQQDDSKIIINIENGASGTGGFNGGDLNVIGGDSSWNFDKDSHVNNGYNDGTLNINNKDVTFDNLTNNGKIIIDVNSDDQSHGKLDVTGTASGTGNINVNVTGSTAVSNDDRDKILNDMFDHNAKDAWHIDDIDWGLIVVSPTTAPDGSIYSRPNGKLSEAGNIATGLIAAQKSSWFAQQNSLLKRMGELRLQNRVETVTISGKEDKEVAAPMLSADKLIENVWIRSYGQQLNYGASVTGQAFKQYVYGVDAGTDHKWQLDADNQLFAGVFLGYGAADTDHRHHGSKSEISNYYAGLYASWLNVDGWYLDATLKAQYTDNELNGNTGANYFNGSYNNWSVGGSLEFGKQIKFKDDWFVEPQLQANYLHILASDYTMSQGLNVNVSDLDAFQLRFGIVAGKTLKLKNGGALQPYFKISGVEMVSTGGKISAMGNTVRPNLDGARAELGAGIIWQLDANNQLHLDYEASFGDKYDKPWGLTAGYRYQF